MYYDSILIKYYMIILENKSAAQIPSLESVSKCSNHTVEKYFWIKLESIGQSATLLDEEEDDEDDEREGEGENISSESEVSIDVLFSLCIFVAAVVAVVVFDDVDRCLFWSNILNRAPWSMFKILFL